jgi:hypothetical protein
MVSVNRKCRRPCIQLRSTCGTCGPVINAANGGVTEARLKAIRILPQIVQEAGHFAFPSTAKRFAEATRHISDIAKVDAQLLPILPIWIICSVDHNRSVCVIVHTPVEQQSSEIGAVTKF